ncbi:MAG: hypothetical protein SOT42_04495, partial [Eubacteriales bacterium]|nr:hypothetical protein [Eubacteriales bacterium]
ITRRWVTVYCPNTKFTKEPSARYLLIITKISIADYTKILDIGLRLYCANQRKEQEEVASFLSTLWFSQIAIQAPKNLKE